MGTVEKSSAQPDLKGLRLMAEEYLISFSCLESLTPSNSMAELTAEMNQ
jgi:hypothetical protein